MSIGFVLFQQKENDYDDDDDDDNMQIALIYNIIQLNKL